MLGGLVTLAGCTMLNSELSIFYALAITSSLLHVEWMYGEAVVLVSNPSSSSVLLFCMLFPFFPFIFLLYVRLDFAAFVGGVATSPANQGGGRRPAFKARSNPFVCTSL